MAGLKGLDPTFGMNSAETLLTGVDQDTVTANPRADRLIAEPDGSVVVTTVTDELRDALAGADEEHRRQVAELSAQMEELGEGCDPADVLPAVEELAALAREARAAGERLYCRMCL
ncbi:hypothetical protein [Amycolatopsis sp. FDAARGOS 1241]|uniref:hypothetical protein n=1 Tax=Amycolatopsis sp. FDAARGOS 1241 TaxID=2778070 RepID=UPI001951329E|nr:hypothetical protein [Amycolatopsis sp. FDAARGOS 1241]QRP48117.1 hypothetical protein I6J71_09660 [Amycolatopsis sp. FDAARGOS 1241]